MSDRAAKVGIDDRVSGPIGAVQKALAGLPAWEPAVDPKGRPLQTAEERPGAWRLVIDHRPRCWACGRVLAEQTARPWRIQCRCHALNCSGEPEPA